MEIKRWLGILLVGGVLACICCYCLSQTKMETEETGQISERAWEEASQKEEVQQSDTPENFQDTGKWKEPEETVIIEESTQASRVEEPDRTMEPYEAVVPQEAEESGESGESESATLPVKQETEMEPKESAQPKETELAEPSSSPAQSSKPEQPVQSEQPVQPIQTAPSTPTPVWEPTPSPEQIVNTPAPSQAEEEHIHDFKKSIWELPTCQKGGYFNNICQICGFEECVTQNPLPHEVEDILIQEGNCMEDTIIRHICKICGFQVKSDTRYTEYDKHEWVMEMVDGVEMKVCIRCGIAVN